jgi:hypothetical protein
MDIVDVVSSDILSRNGESVTMQDQSQGRTQRVFRLVRPPESKNPTSSIVVL